MPVGKNSIKRVSNNGYSQVTTSAPDMENSTVVQSPSPEVVEMVAPKKKTAPKKPTVKKKEETPTPVSNVMPTPDTPEVEEIGEADGFDVVALGEDLPYYLL